MTTTRRWDLAAFLLTVTVRLAAALALPLSPVQPDFAEYSALAHEVRAHGDFGFGDRWREDPQLRDSFQAFMYEPHAARFRTPGFPILLVGIDAVGAGPRGLQVLLAMCDGLVAVLLRRMAGAVWGPRAAGLAVAGWALDPGANYMMTKLGREAVLTLAVVALVALAWRLATVPRLRDAAAVGLVTALGAYVKETTLAVAVACGMWLIGQAWRQAGTRGIPWRPLLVAAAVTSALLAPWLVRNSVVAGHPAGLSTMAPVAMYLGILPADHGFSGRTAEEVRRIDPGNAANPEVAGQRADRLVHDHIRQHPAQAMRAALTNAGWFWSPVTRWQQPGQRASPSAAAVAFAYLLLFALASVGIWRHRTQPFVHLLVFVLVVATLVHLPSVAVPRYRVPFEPLLLVLAASLVPRPRAAETPRSNPIDRSDAPRST